MEQRIPETIDIKLNNLHPNPYQPESRINVNESVAKMFGESIHQHGLFQTPVIRLNERNEYEVADGWQRRAGFAWLVKQGYQEYDTMPCTLHGYTDEQMADIVIEANGVRKDLNPIEWAQYYRKCLAAFKNMTEAQFAERHHKSQGAIANTMRLLELPVKVQQMIISQEISETHGRTLLQLKDYVLIEEMAEEVFNEGLSVAALDIRIKEVLRKQQPMMEEPVEELPKAEEEISPPEEPETEPAEEPVEESPPAEEEISPPIDETAMVINGKETIVEGDIGAGKPPEPEKETETATDETPEPETETKTAPAGTEQAKKETPAASKPEPKKAAAPAPQPAAAKPAWERKMVLEEKGGNLAVSIMKEGAFPIMDHFEGSLEDFFNSLAPIEFLEKAAAKWSPEEEK